MLTKGVYMKQSKDFTQYKSMVSSMEKGGLCCCCKKIYWR